MRFWLIKTGESLPVGASKDRLLRTGMLGKELVARGHEVVWFSGTFDHVRKMSLSDTECELEVSPGFKISLLYGPAYKRNISLARIRHHQEMAKSFIRKIQTLPKPDAVLCSMPTIEFSIAATDYGKKHGIPVVLDLRDRWPDIYLELFPKVARPLLRPLLTPMYRSLRKACRAAYALSGITPEFVQWGLDLAERKEGPDDRHFWHGYHRAEPSAESLVTARAFWKAHDVLPEDFTIAFLGAMSLELDTVVYAARELAERTAGGRRVRLVLCGNGDRLDFYRALVKELKLTNVLFPGWVGKPESWDLLRLASAGLAPYPARSDFVISIPSKIVEYFSAGLPILSSLPGKLEKLLEEEGCGLTYQNRNSTDFVDKVLALYSKPSRRQAMAKRALALFNRNFDSAKIIPEMADYMEGVAHRKPGKEKSQKEFL